MEENNNYALVGLGDAMRKKKMYVDAITKYTDYKDYLLVAERVNGKRFIRIIKGH